MKAVLIAGQNRPPLTHNLVTLAESLRGARAELHLRIEDLRYLTRVGAGFRYPGESADLGDATKALAICTRMRASLLGVLGRGGSEPS